MKKTVMSKRAVDAFIRLLRGQGRKGVGRGLGLLYSSFAQDLFCQAWRYSSDSLKKNTVLVNVVECALQTRGQEAPFFRLCRVSEAIV